MKILKIIRAIVFIAFLATIPLIWIVDVKQIIILPNFVALAFIVLNFFIEREEKKKKRNCKKCIKKSQINCANCINNQPPEFVIKDDIKDNNQEKWFE